MKIPWDEIESLTKYLKEKGLSELTIETQEGKISVKKDIDGVVTPAHKKADTSQKLVEKEAPKGSNYFEVKSPTVGTFYASPSPGADPYVQVGAKVSEGAVLCIIEAMKIMNELTSDVNGTVKEVLVKDGETVEYGQVIMRIEQS